MSNYTKTTNFATKDSLSSGDPAKKIKGTEFNTEFDAIATAVATKADLASPALTGTPTAPTASTGTNTTQIATTAFVTSAMAAAGAGTVTSVGVSSSDLTVTNSPVTGSGTIGLALNTVPVSKGGTGQTSFTDGQLLIGNSSGNTLTKATLTAGTGVTITNGNGSISISATGTSGVSTFSGGSTGLTPSTATSGAVTLGGKLAVANGGTNGSTASEARTNLGLGTIATQNAAAVSITGGTITGITDLAIADGGTGASSAAGARTNLELGSLATLSTVGTSQITNGAVTDVKIADSNVTTAKIANANVTAAKLDGAQSGSAPIFGARAWVNFDGTGTTGTNQTIRGSGNIASVYKDGTGLYTVTFTTAMPDANYSVVGTAQQADSSSASAGHTVGIYSYSTTSFKVQITDPTGNSYENDALINIVIFR